MTDKAILEAVETAIRNVDPHKKAAWGLTAIAQAAIDAIEAAQPEPTEAMIKAGAEAIDNYFHGTKDAPFEGSIVACYKAMTAERKQCAETRHILEKYPQADDWWKQFD